MICADGKRYAIVAALDIMSRRGRVLVVPSSWATAIAALLRRCILECGVPETVRTDLATPDCSPSPPSGAERAGVGVSRPALREKM